MANLVLPDLLERLAQFGASVLGLIVHVKGAGLIAVAIAGGFVTLFVMVAVETLLRYPALSVAICGAAGAAMIAFGIRLLNPHA